MESRTLFSPPFPPSASGCWWLEKHVPFFAMLVVANLAADGVALRLEEIGGNVIYLAMGFLSAQVALMGLWLALGGLTLPVRWLLVGTITLTGALLVATVALRDLALTLAIMSGTIVLGTHATLLPLRSWLGWRIDFDRVRHSMRPAGRIQLRLIDLLGFVTAAALPLALLRLLSDDERLFTGVIGIFACLGSLPMALLVCAKRRSWQGWSLALTAWGILFVTEYFSMGSILGRPGGAVDAILAFNVGLAATVVVNLGLLRHLFGLHLFSVVPGNFGVASPLTCPRPVSLRIKLAQFSDYWCPKTVGELNGQALKLAKYLGESGWHRHDYEDELLLVVGGRLHIEFREQSVWLEEGEFMVVPRGIEHRAVAEEEVHVLLCEPALTLTIPTPSGFADAE